MIIVPLTKGYVTIIDDEDAELMHWRWKAKPTPSVTYACRNKSNGRHEDGRKKYKFCSMHRAVMERVIGRELKTEEQVDHINGDSLDNRRTNLRVCTRQQNNRNTGKRKRNTSGYKGVTKVTGSSIKHWQSSICANGQRVYLGSFYTPEEAHAAYCKAAKEYFGEFWRAA